MRIQLETEYHIKFCEFQHVLCYQELVFLKDFDQREEVCLLYLWLFAFSQVSLMQSLETRYASKQAELTSCTAATAEASANHLAHKDLLAKLTAKEKAVHASFASSIGEGHKFEKYLTKVFKKKVKRAKNKQASG